MGLRQSLCHAHEVHFTRFRFLEAVRSCLAKMLPYLCAMSGFQAKSTSAIDWPCLWNYKEFDARQKTSKPLLLRSDYGGASSAKSAGNKNLVLKCVFSLTLASFYFPRFLLQQLLHAVLMLRSKCTRLFPGLAAVLCLSRHGLFQT